jgi:acetyl-CoA acetyltransferase family protein
MQIDDASIPLGLAWSSPFARWQGPLADLSSLELGAAVTTSALERGGLEPERITRVVVGSTVPQRDAFFGTPQLANRIGARGASGPLIAQACATSVACLQDAALHVVSDPDAVVAVVATDRTSNGPLLVYPKSRATAGAPETTHWVLDSFEQDTSAGCAPVEMAERVAAQEGIERAELDEVALLRYHQYEQALADDRDFQRSYMVGVDVPAGRRKTVTVDEDSGIVETTAEGLAALRPAAPDGVVTFGSQTHPADGSAGMIVTTDARARELSGGAGTARILATGFARVDAGLMPTAPVPAAERALASAGLTMDDVDAVTTHNPFAVNDVFLSRRTGRPVEEMNLYGSSLVWGHPQGPTGARAIAELIEALRRRGGGVGLFTGCAAGDTGAAVVLRVDG